MTKQFVAGIIGAPFGVDGRVKIQSLSGETSHLLQLEKVLLRKNGAEQVYTVEAAFERPLSCKLEGITSPEAAKTLKGAEIIVSREDAAPLAEGEFYVEDLKGLEVYDEGGLLGKISDILEGGGGFLVELTLSGGEKRLVPFRDEFFGPVDLENSRVRLLVRWILE